MKNIADLVAEDQKYSNLHSSAIAAHIKMDLFDRGSFTLFAPTNIAFGKLHEGELAALLKTGKQEKFTTLLRNHIVNAKVYYNDLKDGQQLATINGKTLTVCVKDGIKSIGNSLLKNNETEALNGMLYPVDLMFEPS